MPHRDQELEAECRGLDVCICVHVSVAHYSKSKICNLMFYMKFSGLLWHFMSTNN